MSKSISELQQVLIQGQKLSMQGSLDRRMPDKKSIPYLIDARKGLKEYLNENSKDALALRLLSQAEACLLNYNFALSYLEKAIEISGKNKSDLKRLAALKECQSQWEELELTPDHLDSLGNFLDKKLRVCACNYTLDLTKEWLDSNVAKSKKPRIVRAIQNQGGFCDCEVLANVID
ncbi:DUF2695 domain-containing protein [Clostridium lacusfryxellense]|uniref:DUF2695 domain-containing protein n=1 Tax=Clostridium lacusfryxellense TaxID=205328 RepID=UPI001C0B1957|nr:DUF2695 domain-containing protein [Clostridium lacusfryxellense]MBU3113155.1 DUF2695 domain-containing protein [Clostridium lacusfryxellense]